MTGLTHMPKEIHRRHRGMINPLLSKDTVPEYYEDFVDIVNETIEVWKPNEIRDMSKEMLNLTLRISSRIMFGRHLEDEGFKLGLMIENWVRFVMSVGHLFPYDIPGFPYRSWLNLSQEIENKTRTLIHDFDSNHKSEDTLLSKMIRATDIHGEGISEKDLIGHVSLLMWGSRDAVANAIVWTLFLLTQHPAIYADVVSEVHGILHGTAPTIEQLNKMPFLKCIIKESLRLFPPFPITHRVTGQERELGGYKIPVRTEIGMSVYHTHRIPELYEEPEKFNPHRWNSSSDNNPHLYSFGMGPRACAGFNFGWQEMLTIIPVIIQKFRLELLPGTRVDREIKVALIPQRGMPIKLCPMDNDFRAGRTALKGNVNEMVML
jgi:cytochrome P450